ncbi:MAG: transcription termination/antitermination NusG family protein [Ruminococcus sp.]|nr:transcription termination/antitermination NusG family protein [Ruminococcus sp.]
MKMEMYVLQVKPGYEESAARELQRKGYTAMCPMVEAHIRFGGEWHKRLKILFTQYIFVECDLSDVDYYNIMSAVGVIRFLGCGKPEPLPADEREYIRILDNGGKPVEASKVYVTSYGDKMVLSGLLRKYANNSVRIDLRQRRAWVTVTLHGKPHKITLPVIGI